MADSPKGVLYYTTVGSNVPIQVESIPVTLYSVSVSQAGGSVGYLQIYNGTPTNAGTGAVYTVPVFSGTAGAGTPSFNASRDQSYPAGIQLSQGLTVEWAAGATGTVAHGVNANVMISYTRY